MFLEKVIGHNKQIELLKKSLENNRIAHAYLFIGPEGVGKGAVAGGLASALLCRENNYNYCNCLSCSKVQSLNHPDFHWYAPQGNKFKIDQIREIQKKVLYKPYEGQKKIFVIEGAEAMTTEAANSLLKVLEEPPKDTIFILLANNAYGLLPTILSRCQQIQFNKLSEAEIIQILKEQEINEEKASLAAPLANGSLSKALELIQSENKLAKREKLLIMLEGIKKIDHVNIFKIAEEMEKEKEDIEFTLDVMLFWFRDLLIWKETKEEALLVNIDIIDKYKNYEHQLTRKTLIKAIEVIEDSRRIIGSNANLRLAIEGMFLRLKEVM